MLQIQIPETKSHDDKTELNINWSENKPVTKYHTQQHHASTSKRTTHSLTFTFPLYMNVH
jgi:hypothetical protein